MIHLSSIVYHVMLEHVHTFTSPQPQSHHFDTASTDDDDVYYSIMYYMIMFTF